MFEIAITYKEDLIGELNKLARRIYNVSDNHEITKIVFTLTHPNHDW